MNKTDKIKAYIAAMKKALRIYETKAEEIEEQIEDITEEADEAARQAEINNLKDKLNSL